MNTSFRWILLIAVSIILFIINVDYTAVNLALVPVSTALDTNLKIVRWILSGYTFAWGLLVIPAGYFADRYNKKYLCLTGLGLFLVASIIAGLASSITILIAARIIQGFAGALYAPTIYSLIFLHFPEHQRGKAIGLMSLGIGIGLAAGPFIGGMLISIFNWRSIFFINIPIGLLAALIIGLSENVKNATLSVQTKISKTSILLLSLSISILLYYFQDNQWNEHRLLSVSLLCGLLLCVYLFVFMQNRIKNPLIPLQLFKNRAFTGCCIGIFLEQFSFASIIIATSLYLQKICSYSIFKTSLIYLVMTVVFGIIAGIGGIWVDKTGVRKPVTFGFLLMAVGSILFAYQSTTHFLWSTYFILFILGAGMGVAFTALNTGVVTTLPQKQIGIGSSVFLLMALLANTFSITLTTLIYTKMSCSKLIQLLNTKIILTQSQLNQVTDLILQIGQSTKSLDHFNLLWRSTIHGLTPMALSYGIHCVMLISAIISIFGLFSCFHLLRNKQVSFQSKKMDILDQTTL